MAAANARKESVMTPEDKTMEHGSPPQENQLMIMGYNVAFPTGKKPFPAQLAVMNKVLSALKTGQHALLESPTGSGKTLALLCSTLTFQRQFVKELIAAEEIRQKQHEEQKQQDTNPPKPAEKPAPQEQITPNRRAELEEDDDFAATQPSFDQFRYGNGSSGWISMAAKKQMEKQASSRKRKLPPSFTTQSTQEDFESDVEEVPKLASKRHVPLYLDDATQPTQSSMETGQKRRLPWSFEAQASKTSKTIENHSEFHQTTASSSKAKRISPPTIFFCSRTHSQLAQVVDELKNCPVSYLESPDLQNPYARQLKTCVLGSKANFCVNSKVNKDVSQIDEKCRQLLDPRTGSGAGGGCSFFRKRKKQNELKRVVPPVWDIEDLMQLAKRHRECAFFHTREALVDANIVFCPYNYLLDPSIRSAVGISLKNAIVVLDEAHNVEDTCRSSASVEVTSDLLAASIQSFTSVIKYGQRPPNYLSLLKLLNGLQRWLLTVAKDAVKPSGFEEESNVWSGLDSLAVLDQYCGANRTTLPSIQADLAAVVEFERELSGNEGAAMAEEDEEPSTGGGTKPGPGVLLSTMALSTVQSLLNVVDYLFRDQSQYIDDYKLVVFKSRGSRRKPTGRFSLPQSQDPWEIKLCLWCLNAAVAFSDVVQKARSVLLTSGTLSPMDSFAGELGVEFSIRLEANHVVNLRKQVLVGAIMKGPNHVDLSSTYANQQDFRYQDAMGQLLLDTSRVVPGGVLMFLPSYSLLDKLVQRWKQTGVWEQLEAHKRMFTEPRNAGKDFDKLLDDYKFTIRTTSGAVFMAVYRGKVSEGIDFSNANARAVLAVGIPYPSVKELQVSLKRQYQDTKARTSKVIVNGSTWYQLQAFRALNQALGRCIRHRHDYGMILLLDSRHRFQAHTKSLSKWMRPCMQEFEQSDDCLSLASRFFERNAQEFGSGVASEPIQQPQKQPLQLQYEPKTTKSAKGGRRQSDVGVASTMQSKLDSVRAFLATKQSSGPKVFSIFQPQTKRQSLP